MFPCPYAETYPLWDRIVGHTFNNVSLTWVERLSGYPVICRQQIFLQIGVIILALILLIIAIWFKFFRKRHYYFYSDQPLKKI